MKWLRSWARLAAVSRPSCESWLVCSPPPAQVLYHGKPLEGLNPGVAIVFQSFALYPWMTVLENIKVVLKAASLPGEEIRTRAGQVVRTVGLAGFEGSYPRELSGGMKQRVGMARAFSLNPEMLFMDEPFSQVDALTAESLRAEVLDIWATKDKTSSILIVSHDIKEVVYMADRIVLLGAHPGTVRTIVANPLPRPRDYRSPALLQLVDQLHDIITGSEMPDIATAHPAPAAMAMEPIPSATVSEIMGLIEYLDARGGQEDVFRIASDTRREYGTVINVANAAELLDLVETPKRLVRLAPEGVRLVKARVAERKAIWRERLLTLGLFREVRAALERSSDQELRRESVLEMLALAMPSEDYESVFETLWRWGRFADLWGYDEERQVLSLK